MKLVLCWLSSVIACLLFSIQGHTFSLFEGLENSDLSKTISVSSYKKSGYIGFRLLSFLGRKKVYLSRNIVNGVNVLEQEMINRANTIYFIRYEYILDGDVVIPDNSLLIFEGGRFKHGCVVGHNTIVSNQGGVIFKNVILRGSFSGEARSSWFEGDDDDIFSNAILFDNVFIESDLFLDRLRTPTTHKSTSIQGINHPTIYTDFNDDTLKGNGINVFRISTPMGVKEVSLKIKDLNIVDVRYDPKGPLVKSMSSGVFVFPHDPNTNMNIHLENLFVQTRGDSFGFSHEREEGYSYDGTFNLCVNNCYIESGEFCIETYKPGNVKEMHFKNSSFVSSHSFRPELSLGTHAVARQKRKAYIYVSNCTFDKGIENGIHEYASNPKTKYTLVIDSCVFNKYLYVNEYNVHHAGEGVVVIANNCIFKNNANSIGGASGGERLEFNDCTFQLSYTGNAYGLFAGESNIFRRCTFDCSRMQRFYGNYRNGDPLLYKEIIFDDCTFKNTTIVVSRYEESIEAGMNYQVKDCRFEGNSSIRHWNTTDFNSSKRMFNTEMSSTIGNW